MSDPRSNENRAATEAAFIRYAHRLTAFVLASRGRSFASAADDVVNESFRQLHAQRVFLDHTVFRPAPDGSGAEARRFAFLCVVARRVSNRMRGRPVAADSLDAEGLPEPEVTEREHPDLTAIQGEQARLLREALDQLDPVFREPLVMHTFAGLSYESIARELSLHLGTVRSRVNRAKEKLRPVLERMGV